MRKTLLALLIALGVGSAADTAGKRTVLGRVDN